MPSSSRPKQKRRKFTEEEKEALRQGVRICGAGNWADIRSLRMLVLGKRTNIQLKDLFRTLKRQGEFPNVELSELAKKRRAAKQPIDDSIFDSSDEEEERKNDNDESDLAAGPTRKRRYTIHVDDNSDEEENDGIEDIKQPARVSIGDADEQVINVETDDAAEPAGNSEQSVESNVILIDDSGSTNNEDGATRYAGATASRPKPMTNPNDFVSAIDALFLESLSDDSDLLSVGDIQRRLVVQFKGLKYDRNMGDFIMNRLEDLKTGRVHPGEKSSDDGLDMSTTSHTDKTTGTSNEQGDYTDVTVAGSKNAEDDYLKEIRPSVALATETRTNASTYTCRDDATTIPLLDNDNAKVFYDESSVPSSSSPGGNSVPEAKRSTQKSGSNCDCQVDSSNNDDDDIIQAVNKVFEACKSHIQVLQDDKSRTRNEIMQETTWWRQQVHQWETRLLSAIDSQLSSQEHESLWKDINRILSAMSSIKVFHLRIRELANDKLLSREEVAKRTMEWRSREKAWKERLIEHEL